MSSQNFLAIDLGAESGRGVVGAFDGERVTLTEIGRFATGAAAITHPDGTVRWDIDGIFSEVAGLVDKARAGSDSPIIGGRGASLAGVGVDSWGVDFGLIDKDNNLIAPPVCYRDRSHSEARERMLARISATEIWDATGIQGMPFNTLYQVDAIASRAPEQLAAADRLLLMPDLIANRLTRGTHRSVEMSNGSTTQMMRPGGAAWNVDFLTRAGLPSHFLGPTVASSTQIGTVDGTTIPIYAPGTHDTASAVAAVPVAGNRSWAFLSSGTWSLLGCELRQPVLSHDAMRAGFSNEAGVDGTTRFLKNIMGLWLVQECRRHFGGSLSYQDLTQLASEARPTGLIDATDNRFLSPADMVAEIKRACVDTGQPSPDSEGEIVRCCLESLALAYRRSIRQLESLLGRKIEVLHVIGGGSNNAVLNQWTADACGIPVVAGPSEATGLGNILAQLIGAGLVTGWNEARAISRASFAVREFTPDVDRHAAWAAREEIAVKDWER